MESVMTKKNKYLSGTSLAGTSTKRDRADNDYYATPTSATSDLFNVVDFSGNFLEPCVGAGHIAEVIKQYYPGSAVIGLDLVDRGYENTIVSDFLTYDFGGAVFDNIVTNPPYSIAQEFLEKGMQIVAPNGKIAMFLKIQFLEGSKRKKMFEKYPPEYIYVFSKRQNPWRNGRAVDENGKPWQSTMCFAWFVWKKGFAGEPTIRWI